jgi:hypothetical protein
MARLRQSVPRLSRGSRLVPDKSRSFNGLCPGPAHASFARMRIALLGLPFAVALAASPSLSGCGASDTPGASSGNGSAGTSSGHGASGSDWIADTGSGTGASAGVVSSGTDASGVSSGAAPSGASSGAVPSGTSSGAMPSGTSSGSTVGPGSVCAGHDGGNPFTTALPHNPSPAICMATNLSALGDAGASCMTDSDCQKDGGPYQYCVEHTCLWDRCLRDSDCAAGSACSCYIPHPSQLIPANQCVPSACRVDTDCAGGICTSTTGACGASTGNHCRSCADTCITDTDCTGNPAGTNCLFVPAVGHWQCAPVSVCMG